MNLNFELTKEEVLESVSAKIAEDYYCDYEHDIDDCVNKLRDKANNTLEKMVRDRIQEELDKLFPEILNRKITPLNRWGEESGKSETIKDLLYEKALNYWDEKVDSDGRGNKFGSKTRAQLIIEKASRLEFEKLIEKHLSETTKALKESFQSKLMQDIATQINKVFK